MLNKYCVVGWSYVHGTCRLGVEGKDWDLVPPD